MLVSMLRRRAGQSGEGLVGPLGVASLVWGEEVRDGVVARVEGRDGVVVRVEVRDGVVVRVEVPGDEESFLGDGGGSSTGVCGM